MSDENGETPYTGEELADPDLEPAEADQGPEETPPENRVAEFVDGTSLEADGLTENQRQIIEARVEIAKRKAAEADEAWRVVRELAAMVCGPGEKLYLDPVRVGPREEASSGA